MDKITGNFTTQANKDFPLDCETLQALQGLTSLTEIIANIAGDKVVLYGCEPNAENTRRGAGYVFVKTKLHPEGEVLPWEGGATTSGMYVKVESVSVNANNVEYPQAYTKRSLAPGVGIENYNWADFVTPKTVRQLMEEDKQLRAEITKLSPAPLGIVQIWAGAKVPEGYLLCDGSALKISDYPELYAVLGSTFNRGTNASGTTYTTQSGYFRLPDLRGRFIVGLHDSDPDYTQPGKAGGAKAVALTVDQLPSHDHGLKFRTEKWGDNANRRPFPDAAGDNDYTAKTLQTGGGQTHENRPPYYVMAYIIRAK